MQRILKRFLTVLVLASLSLVPAVELRAGQQSAAQKKAEALRLIKKLERKSYEQAMELSKAGPVVLWYWGSFSPPCFEVAPLMSEFAAAHKAVTLVRSGDADDPSSNELSADEITTRQLYQTPTFVVFRDGKEAFRRVGLYLLPDDVYYSNASKTASKDTRQGVEKLFSDAQK